MLFEDYAAGALLRGEVNLLLHVVRDGWQQRRLHAVTVLVRHEGEGGDSAVVEGEAVGGREVRNVAVYWGTFSCCFVM